MYKRSLASAPLASRPLALAPLALAIALLPDLPGVGGWAWGQTAPAEGDPAPVDTGMTDWRLNLGVQEHKDGALYASPPNEGLTSYFVAPENLLGDWTGRSTISFEKMSHGGDYYPPDSYGAFGDVVLRNGDMLAHFTIEPDHSGEWRLFSVPLGEAGWALSGGAQAVDDVLAQVTDFRIRAEYGVGTDYSALRSVSVD